MWVEVTSWDNKQVKGILKNDPRLIPTLKSGAKVSIKEADVFDYILQKGDGTTEGNETGKLIMKYRKAVR